jgi:hypothetical protein
MPGRARTLRAACARQQPRPHDALNDAALDDVEGPLRVARVVAQEDLVVRVIPAVRALRQALIRRVADLEAPHILCAARQLDFRARSALVADLAPDGSALKTVKHVSLVSS